MRICGIKFGHDGSVAVIDDGRLLFSAELEKFDNETRHRLLHDLDFLFRLAKQESAADGGGLLLEIAAGVTRAGAAHHLGRFNGNRLLRHGHELPDHQRNLVG